MEPNSTFLVVVLLLAAAGLIAAAIRYRPLATKIVSGLLAVMLSATAGIAMVNDYYGYYQTWSQLSADLSGNYSQFATSTASKTALGASGSGRVESISLPGAASGINRKGYVYLPHQYFERKYAHTRFPVLELLHGSPGDPVNWLIQINVAAIMDKLMSKHLIGPMIVVMPAIDAGNRFQDCVNAPGARDDTYISQDVPRDIRAHFRVSTVPAQWGIAGYSSGGYCAANLALRHPAAFGAAGIMDGYYRPTDGPAASALHFDARAEAQNNPLVLAQHLTPGASPLPALWLSSGTGQSKYSKGAQEFVAALHGVEAVTLVRQPGAGHNFYAWRAVIPRMISWMWSEIAPPELRVQFPVAGPVDNSIVVPPLKPSAHPSTSSAPRGHGTSAPGSTGHAATAARTRH